MDLSFYPLTLEAIDQADAESLCLFVGEDERPLTGLAGLADWRLSGGLSRLLRKGLVQGSAGEALLTPGAKLGFRKLFLFGLGPIGNGNARSAQQAAQWPPQLQPPQLQDEEELAARVSECLRRMQAAGVENAAMQLPARLPLNLGIRTLIDETQAPARGLVFGPDPAALVRALSHAASRGPMESKHERRVIKVPGPPRPAPPLRLGPPPKQAPVEVPKASPLSFAPSNARGPGTGAGTEAPATVPAASAAAIIGAQTLLAAPVDAPPVAPAAPALPAAVVVAPATAAAAEPLVSAIPPPAPAAAIAPAVASGAELPAPVAPAVAGPNSEPDIPVAPHVPDSVPPAAKAADALATPAAAGPAPAVAALAQPPSASAPTVAAVAPQATVPVKPAPAPSQVPISATPIAKADPSAAPAAPAPPAEPAPKLPTGKSPLPIDHKAQRFVPPKPKVVEEGKGKKKR